MLDNVKAVPERFFQKPMTWATDEQLVVLRGELEQELLNLELHRELLKLGAERNGLQAILTEIKNRGSKHE